MPDDFQSVDTASKSQKGFSLKKIFKLVSLSIVGFLIILAIGEGVFIYFLERDKASLETKVATSSATPKVATDSAKKSDETALGNDTVDSGNFTLKYPEGWQVYMTKGVGRTTIYINDGPVVILENSGAEPAKLVIHEIFSSHQEYKDLTQTRSLYKDQLTDETESKIVVSGTSVYKIEGKGAYYDETVDQVFYVFSYKHSLAGSTTTSVVVLNQLGSENKYVNQLESVVKSLKFNKPSEIAPL